jgi:hypothetical protein
MGGWGSRFLAVSPAGRVLPCHAAESIAGMTFPTVREVSLHEAADGCCGDVEVREPRHAVQGGRGHHVGLPRHRDATMPECAVTGAGDDRWRLHRVSSAWADVEESTMQKSLWRRSGRTRGME